MDKNILQFVMNMKHMFLYLFLVALGAAGVLYVSGYEKIAVGLLVGMLTGTLYFLLMLYRVYKATKMPSVKAIFYMKTGWWVRLSFILLVLILSTRFAEINFWAVVTGLFLLHIIVILNVFIVALRNGRN